MTYDHNTLVSDIAVAAGRYTGLHCAVAVGGKIIYTDVTAPDIDYYLDAAGGVLLGLSVLVLIDDGKISMDTQVEQFFSAGELPAGYSPTVHSLLTHTSGLPDPVHSVLLSELHQRGGCEDADCEVPFEEDAVNMHRDLSSQMKLLRRTGKAEYHGAEPSPMDEAILAELVTRLSGKSLVEFQRERIFEPLEMTGEELYRPFMGDKKVHILSLDGLRRFADSLLSSDVCDLCAALARDGCSLPMGKHQGILCARSIACGNSVNILLDKENGESVVVAAPFPLQTVRDGTAFRRFDLDVVGCMNRQRIRPAHIRMERLSVRNLSNVVSIELEPEQLEFVSAPAVAAAEVALRGRDERSEGFAITEKGATAGLLTFAGGRSPEDVMLDMLIIDLKYQQRGFGSAAVRWARKYQKERGAKNMWVCVDRRNAPALALYRKFGFETAAVHGGTFVMKLGLE